MTKTAPESKALPLEVLTTAREHNAKTIQKQFTERKICLQDYYFLNKDCTSLIDPGNLPLDSSRKFDDVIAGALVGALPYYAQHGDDALLVKDDGSTENVELKLSLKSKDNYKVGAMGGIFCGSPGKTTRCSLRSDISATYDIAFNLSKKNRPTYLVVIDNQEWSVVCGFRMEGEIAVSYLTTNMNTGEVKKTKQRDIKLSSFVNKGEEVDLMLPAIGLLTWESKIIQNYNLKISTT